jgi:hypothetical protein
MKGFLGIDVSKGYADLPVSFENHPILIDLWGLWEGLSHLDYTRLGDFFEVK